VKLGFGEKSKTPKSWSFKGDEKQEN